MSSPPLIGRLPAQEARSYAAGPSRPQAPIQRRQRLIHELRLCTLVNLSWSATQPATGELAVAQPTTVFINRIVRGPESGRRSAITSYLDIQIIQRDDVALRARRVSAPIKMVQSSEPRVAPSRRSKLALTSARPQVAPSRFSEPLASVLREPPFGGSLSISFRVTRQYGRLLPQCRSKSLLFSVLFLREAARITVLFFVLFLRA